MKLLIGLCLVCLPLKHLRLNSPFGYRSHPVSRQYRLHQGIDLYARADTVYAVMNGLVGRAGFDARLGIYIRLDHGAWSFLYGHLRQVLVAPRDSVRAGDPIGITGATGRVTGEHLHFSICYRHRFVNPIHFLYQTITFYGKKQKL
jgi:murein DD-endopeptidase MepM/ murein hydrolase activator NlpD